MRWSLFFLGLIAGSLLVSGCARPGNPQVSAPAKSQSVEQEVEKPIVAEQPVSKTPAGDSSSRNSSKLPAKKPRRRPTLDERVLFQPSDASEGNYQPENLHFEDVFFHADDGTRLHAWFCPAENPRAIVLFAHGNGGNVSFWAERMRELQQDHRVSVLIFDYRGYGKSEGKPTVPGVLEDARAAATFLARKVGVKESDLVLMGQSMGGAVAVQLAAEIQPRGLVLESTFSSFRDVADHHARWASWLVPREKLNSLASIGPYRGPLLQYHGDADVVVPIQFGEKLFAAANDPKAFYREPGGGHETPLPRDYRWQLDDFFEEVSRDAE